MFTRPSLSIEDFNYHLPDERIAYTPAPLRSDSKLLVWDKAIIAETTYSHISNCIPTNATLFFNNSKVIAARILFDKNLSQTNEAEAKNNTIEIFCLEPTEKYTPVILAMQATQKVEWICLVGGAKKWKTPYLEKIIQHDNKNIIIRAKKTNQEDGKFLVEFTWDDTTITFSELLTIIGNIPLPPYIHRQTTEEDKDRYQTTYAIEEGSVAAPTAGLHFNETVFEKLIAKNINTEFVTLHVGAGTFMPVKVDTIDQHIMHAEFIEVAMSTLDSLIKATNESNLQHPVIAVGTTSLRTIESLYWLGVKLISQKKESLEISSTELSLAQWDAIDLAHLNITKQAALIELKKWLTENKLDKLIAKTQLMITPGYTFRICNALVTNFHQPKSTLLLIIAAIAGDQWKSIYEHALSNKYRFLSYGDGCLFWIKQ
jgi:S-adenosylmethionine:tRNA ribosyltransferase-isomerase